VRIVKTKPKYLSEHIKCFYSAYAEKFGNTLSTHRRLPDGTLDIVFNLGSDIALSHDGINYFRMPDVALTGLYQKGKFIAYSGAVHLFGVVFQPGYAHLFVNDALGHYQDCAVDASLIFGRDIYFLSEQLRNTADDAARQHLLESFLLQYLKGKDNSQYSSRIFEVTRQIHRQEGNLLISDLYKENFMSGRTFRRRFIECVGLSPKKYASITRIKAFSKQYDLSRSSYSDIFSHLGYTDHAHFTGDFQKIAGTSPSAYFKQLDEIGAEFIHLI
jgi:AraC-like DNA-binding protein